MMHIDHKTANWIEYLRADDLFEWNTNKIDLFNNDFPIYITSSESKVTSNRQEISYISLHWRDEATKDAKFEESLYPRSLDARLLVRHLKNGKLHNNDITQPAITVDEINVYWPTMYYCQKYNLAYRPGFNNIEITNYREYWHEGKFIRAEWGSAILNWWSSFYTTDGPNWDKCIKQSGKRFVVAAPFLVRTEKNLIELMRSTQKPVDILANRLFEHISDEMRFMDIVRGCHL
jgi:hypothetical protein